MKIYIYTPTETDLTGMRATWSVERGTLRIESGPEEFPQEMIAEWQGISEWGAKHALKLHVEHMIGLEKLIPAMLKALQLPA